MVEQMSKIIIRILVVLFWMCLIPLILAWLFIDLLIIFPLSSVYFLIRYIIKGGEPIMDTLELFIDCLEEPIFFLMEKIEDFEEA